MVEQMTEQSYERFCVERREQIMGLISDAARCSGRSSDEVLVEAVSKTVDVAEVACAWKAGWTTFAENRPQELERKLAGIKESYPEMVDARFDMIGNLQKNKINHVLGYATLIHSVSTSELAEAISKRAEAKDIVQPVLLEVNVSGEQSKSGFTPSDVTEGLPRICTLAGIDVRGLMTMAPAGNIDIARRTFSDLRELRDRLEERSGASLPELSCGMSDDFAAGIAEGATIVRLGRVVFSPSYEL